MKRSSAIEKCWLTRKEHGDLKILIRFTEVYCRAQHSAAKLQSATADDLLSSLGFGQYRLCNDCWEFLYYAVERRLLCPLDPKPICKHCEVHCYRPGHREKVRDIMRYSGRKLIARGRLDLLWHYLL